MPDSEIRVALVEDDRSFRESLALLIDGTPGFRCAGRHGSVEEALAALGKSKPDVVLLDVHLPAISGPEGAHLLTERYPGLLVLMLTVYAEEDLIFESLCNGACGYLLKKTPPAQLLEAIREARDGGSPMSSEIARKVVRKFRRPSRPALGAGPDATRLTPQETRLLQLLCDGHSYRSASSEMNVSVNTIRNYIRSVYEKLQVHSKSEAVGRALRGGLLR
jgi:DNA-binding NarL/FixJ family response regulator